MKSDVMNARDYTNVKGKQLLTYLQSESKNHWPVFVAGPLAAENRPKKLY